MTRHLEEREFDAIRGEDPLERYRYFVEEVLDNHVIYTLGDEREFGLIDDPTGVSYACLWSHERFAEAERERDWKKYRVLSFALDEWLERLLPDLAGSGVDVGVFPVWDRGAWVMGADELRTELLHALAADNGG